MKYGIVLYFIAMIVGNKELKSWGKINVICWHRDIDFLIFSGDVFSEYVSKFNKGIILKRSLAFRHS